MCFDTKKQQDVLGNRLLFGALSVSLRLPFLASTACFDALATNSSLDCLLYASRSQCERLLQGAGGDGIRPYGVGCIILPKPCALWTVGDAVHTMENIPHDKVGGNMREGQPLPYGVGSVCCQDRGLCGQLGMQSIHPLRHFRASSPKVGAIHLVNPYLSSVEPKRMLPRALSWSSKVLSLGSSASTNVIVLSQNLPIALSSSRL